MMPLSAMARQYHVYVVNETWRHRLFMLPRPEAWGLAYSLTNGPVILSRINFETGQVVHWGYAGTPPRTPGWLCAHELTHIVEHEHTGLAQLRVPTWAWEGFADYAGIENRQSFDSSRVTAGVGREDADL